MTSPSETTDNQTPALDSKFHEGDKVTINRGKHKGENGTVLGVDTETGTYAIKLGNGFVTASGATLNVPSEARITRAQFDRIVQAHGLDPAQFAADADQVFGA